MVLQKALPEPLVHFALQGDTVQQAGHAGLYGVPSALVLLQSDLVAAELSVQGVGGLECLQQAGSVDDALPGTSLVQYHGFLRIPDHVPDALLVLARRECRVIVHGIPVRHQAALERLSQQLKELLVGMPRANLEQYLVWRAGHL